MKTIRKMILTGAVASSLVVFTAGVNAQTQTGSQGRSAQSAQQKSFKGKVTEVDKEGKTITVNNQKIHILPTTKVTSEDKPVSLNEIQEGQQVAGQYKQSAENKMEALSVEVQQAVGGTQDSATTEKGASFSGKVSRADPESKTLTIGSQTYRVLPTTRITKGGEQASFEDIKAGTQLSGQYKQSAENKMEVLSLEIPQTAVGGTQSGSTTQTGTSAKTGTSFSGKVSKIDPSAKTLTVGSQTIHVLPTTRITSDDDQQVSFNDIKVGEQLSGQYKQSAENKLEALTIEVQQAVGGTKDSATSQQGSSFTGKVSSIDPAARTLMIGNRTFQLLPTTTITTESGQPATLTSVKANQEVSGTYKQSADGKLELLTLRVGGGESSR